MGGNRLTKQEMLKQFPFSEVYENQQIAFEKIEQHDGTVLLEAPTGTGKTAIGYAFLKAVLKKGKHDKNFAGRCVYVTRNKTLVAQVQEQHPDVEVAFGKNEYQCLYYGGDERADNVPCSFLVSSGKCGHYVDQTTGKVRKSGCEKCPYYEQMYHAKKSNSILVCTTAFYLFTFLFNKSKWGEVAAVVFDEAHAIADTVRHLLSYDISDYRISRAIKLLERIGSSQHKQMLAFSKTMQRVVLNHKEDNEILDFNEIKQLLKKLESIDANAIRADVDSALSVGSINEYQERETLQHVEKLVFDLRRYIRTFEFALPYGENHKPLAYAYAHTAREREQESTKVSTKIVIRSYFVHGIIRALQGTRTIAYSATIGNSEAFKMDTGIDFPFYSLPSAFPSDNTRIYLPTDTPDLSVKKVKRGELARLLNTTALLCSDFKQRGLRSLFVAPSNKEREHFITLCENVSVSAMSYGNGITAREAARRFKNGEANVLAGTTAQYSEGVDLPNQIASVIFSLRPDYPSPRDPMSQFEYKRFGIGVWRLWNWRVMIRSLQTRGRNVRGKTDIGITFFLSKQYHRFVHAALPKHLRAAYRADLTLAECVEDANKLFESKK